MLATPPSGRAYKEPEHEPFYKAAILAFATVATIAAPMAGASARDRGWHGPRYHHHHGRGGDAVAAGVIGLAAGALIGSALSQPAEPRVIYEEPIRDDRYYPHAPASYRGGLEPWSPEWRDYCSRRYRSFDQRSGTYRGYDGRDHFCQAD